MKPAQTGHPAAFNRGRGVRTLALVPAEEKLTQLLTAARALRLAYLDKAPTQAKAAAWLRLHEAIHFASAGPGMTSHILKPAP